MDSPDNELRRGFGLSTTTYVVIASMVGVGILVSPGYMMLSLKNYPVIFGLWAFGGVLAICGALCVAELAAALPHAGGEYVYLREAYGPMPAFLSGWTSFLLGFSAPLAVTSHVAAIYVLTPLGIEETESGTLWLKITAAMIIVVVTVPNLLGHRQSAWMQNVTTIAKLALFVGLVVAGFLFGRGQMAHISEGDPITEIEVGTAATQLFYVMFAYTGWNAASYLAGEVRDPGTVLPRALLLGSGVVIVLYLALNLVFAYAIPLDDSQLAAAASAQRMPQLVVERLFGARITNAFSVGIGLAFLATVNAWIVTGPRVYYAMAKDGLFPSIAGRVSPRTHVPTFAMIAQSACAILILFVTEFDSLYQYASVGLSLFALLVVGAVYVLRVRRPEMPRPFRVPGYPVVPAIFIVSVVFMAGFAFTEWPEPSFYSVGTILLGVPFFYVWRAVSPGRPSAGFPASTDESTTDSD